MKPTEMKKRIDAGTRKIYDDGAIKLGKRITSMLGWQPGQYIRISVDAEHRQIILNVQ